jgi:hypothetical protein
MGALMPEAPPPIYRSEFCEVNSYTPNYPDPTLSFYIGNADESYDSPNWPSREAMIIDLTLAIEALKAGA